MILVSSGPLGNPLGPPGPYSPVVILTVIEHMSSCPLDRLAGWFDEAVAAVAPSADPPTTAPASLTLRVVRPWAGDAVPSSAADCGDGLVVLGGQGNAYDDVGTPWLLATRHLLADAALSGLPTLGIGLGAQLLAIATGGRVQVAAPPGREAGGIDVVPRPDAATDPLLGRLAAQVPADHPLSGGVLATMPSLHADSVVDLPVGAVWLASSRLYPYQAFRVGRAAWGLQFHPEASEEVFTAWAELHEDVDTAAVVAEYREHATEIATGGRMLAESFVAVVRTSMAVLPGVSR